MCGRVLGGGRRGRDSGSVPGGPGGPPGRGSPGSDGWVSRARRLLHHKPQRHNNTRLSTAPRATQLFDEQLSPGWRVGWPGPHPRRRCAAGAGGAGPGPGGPPRVRPGPGGTARRCVWAGRPPGGYAVDPGWI